MRFRNFGFTLAETLITLGIIGIVAALTIPTLIQKHNEKVWVTSYLRVYNTLETAYKLALNENGPVENWPGIVVEYDNGSFKIIAYRDDFFIYNAFRPYLEAGEEYLVQSNTSGNCMPETSYLLNNIRDNASFDLYHFYPSLSLKSGECIAFGGGSSKHSFFRVDINGKKGPNTLGKDQFVFGFAKERLAPYGWHDTADCCNVHSNEEYREGTSCGSWIIKYRNMDYLHLPFEEIKKRWKSLRYW